jgi:hypothetical protein
MPSDPRGRRLPGPLSILTAVFVLLVVAAVPLTDGTHGALLRPVDLGGSSAAAPDMELAATVRKYYLATNGSDSNSGTKSRPWKSIYNAINRMTKGGILYVRGGTYSYSGENIIGARRTSTTRITITNYPGESPVFKTTSTQAIFMWFRNAANITVQHLTVFGDPNSPNNVSHGGAIFQLTGNTSGIVLSGNKAYGGPNWADTQHGVYIGAGSVRDIQIKWNLFNGQGGGGAGFHSYHDPNGRRITVSNNVFTRWDTCLLVWSNTSALAVKSNTITACRVGIRYHESRGTSVTGNKAARNSQTIQRDSKAYLHESSNSWN